MVVRKGVTEFKYTQKFLDTLFGDDLHAKRVHSLANATLVHHRPWIGIGPGRIEQACH